MLRAPAIRPCLQGCCVPHLQELILGGAQGGKARKNFRVLGFKKKRTAAETSDSKDLQDAFDRSVQRARTWMAGPDDGAAEDSDEEDQSEEVPDDQRAEDPAGAGGSD